MKTKLLTICLFLFTSQVFADESSNFYKTDIPNDLFGVKLGQVHDFHYGEKYNPFTLNVLSSSTLPAEKIVHDYNRFGSPDSYIWFKPLKINKNFPYKEKFETTPNGVVSTYSVRAVLVVPSSFKKYEKMKKTGVYKKKIMSVKWEEIYSLRDAEDANWWAQDACDIFTSRFKVKPFISGYIHKGNLGNASIHLCEFIEKDRILTIGNRVESGVILKKVFELSYRSKIIDKKIKNAEEFEKSIIAKEILDDL